MFGLKNVFHALYQNRVLNGIVVITIAIGLMFPLALLSTISMMVDRINLCKYEDPQNRIVSNLFGVYMEPEKIDEMLKDKVEGVKDYGYITYYRQLVFTEKQMSINGISGMTQSYLELEGYRLMEGRLITEEELLNGTHVCMIQQNQNDTYFHLKIGDMISIMGTEYEVVGFVDVPKMYGSIMVPYRCIKEIAGSNSFQIRVSLQMEKEEAAQKFAQTGISFLGSIADLSYGDDINAPYVESIQMQVEEKIKDSLQVLVVSVFAILFILIGKTQQERYRIGMKLGIGAGNACIYKELFAENLILMGTALVIDLLCFPIVIRQMRTVYGYPSAWMLGLIIAALTILIAAVTWIVFRIVVKKAQPIVLLKEED